MGRNEVDEGITGEDKSQKQETSRSPEEEDSMMKVMGFGSFSSTHKSNATGHEKSAKLRMGEESKRRAMRFDVESMFKSAAASAQQRNMEANLKLEEEGRSGLQGKNSFIVPATEKEKSKEKKNKDDHIDPRERILRHAPFAKENPYWISPAYKKTQPVPIFREHDPDEPAEKRSKTVTNLAGITGAGGYPSQKPERQTKPTSQLGQH